MSHREVMQQALEALEEATSYTSCPTWSPSMTEECKAAASALRAALAEPVEPVQWTDADADAARLALELEALLLDTKDLAVVSRWWDSGHDALELHRQRLRSERAHGIGGSDE